MAKTGDRAAKRKRRHTRIRRQLRGDAERLRLSVFRSARHIYVQAIDDRSGKTVASASTRDKEVREKIKTSPGNRDAASVVGKGIGEKLKQTGVERVVFDRGGFRFHGRVKALADGAREAGLKF